MAIGNFAMEEVEPHHERPQWHSTADREQVHQQRRRSKQEPGPKKPTRPQPPAARLIQGDFVPREKTGRNRRRHTGNTYTGTEQARIPATSREHRQRRPTQAPNLTEKPMKIL